MNSEIIIKFTTTTEQEDILKTSNDIRLRLKERLGNISDDEFDSLLKQKRIKVNFTIIFNTTNKVSINDCGWNDLVADSVYFSGNSIHTSSIKIEHPTTATIIINIE